MSKSTIIIHAYLHQMVNELKKAFDDYGKAIRINSKYAKAYEYRGDVCEKMGSKKAAISDYRFAAQFYREEGKGTEALKVVEKKESLESG